MSSGPTSLPESGQRERSRRWLPRLRDARIRSKLALILVVPVAAVIALAGVRLVTIGQGAVDATRVRALTRLALDVSALAQDLHKERMAAAVFLADHAAKPDAYNLRIRSTDERIKTYTARREALGDVPQAVSDRLRVIDDHLTTLNSTRQEVIDRKQMPVAAAILRYGVILSDLVSYSEVLGQLPGEDALADARRAVAAFARAKNATEEQEAVAFAALSTGRFDEEQFSSFVATLTAQQEALLAFSRSADPGQQSLVNSTVTGDAVVLADKVSTDLTRSVGQRPLLTAQDATNAIGAVNDLMRWAEARLQADLLEQADQARSAVIRQALVESGLVLLTLIVAIALAVVLARSLNHSLRRLREGALSVANHDLPEAVSRLRDIGSVGDGGVEEIVREVRDPIRLTNRDEIGQVALAFNVVHKEAVRIAAEQAALRTSVSAMFLNLARRSQTLVDRMIGELDAIERGEEDPKRLAQLFELDHLATRMRRNDENLLVLAGADSAVPRREDALLVDVLRAAQSEVEHYNRIEFGTVDTDISVAAHAVNDVVRLVAELLDNATRFSPPTTTVVADARRIRDYVLIQIEDRGLGLSNEQLEALNRRLESPATVDVASFRLMGLAVVSRLAARYGIRVELRRNVEGGTVAQVTLPSSTVVLPKRRGIEQPIVRPRQPLAVEQSPATRVTAGLTESPARTATLTDQWRPAAAPAPSTTSWQSTADARNSGFAVNLGSAATPQPTGEASLGTPLAAASGTSASPLLGSSATGALPRRHPGTESPRPTTPMTPTESPRPTAPPAATLPAGPVAGMAATPNRGVRREEEPKPPIFEEMEAVWFRSHGNDSTAVFTLPALDAGSPAQPSQPPATGRATPAPAPPAYSMPVRDPGGATRSTPPAPPSYQPAAPAQASAATPPPPPPPRGGQEAWRTAADEGWTLASRAAEPASGGTTRSGLPKRVPQAQLVPGGVEPKGGRARSRRTPDEVRGLLSAYHRGVQRGRSAGADLNSTSNKETSG